MTKNKSLDSILNHMAKTYNGDLHISKGLEVSEAKEEILQSLLSLIGENELAPEHWGVSKDTTQLVDITRFVRAEARNDLKAELREAIGEWVNRV